MITHDIQTYLEKAIIPIRLSCATPSGWPIVLSLWYLYRDQRLFCATQESAKVVSYLSREPRCGFEIASDVPPYCGVRGQGMATIDIDLGTDILRRLLVRYLGGIDNTLAKRLLSPSRNEVAIIIKPINLHTWNYAARMNDAISDPAEKPCP